MEECLDMIENSTQIMNKTRAQYKTTDLKEQYNEAKAKKFQIVYNKRGEIVNNNNWSSAKQFSEQNKRRIEQEYMKNFDVKLRFDKIKNRNIHNAKLPTI